MTLYGWQGPGQLRELSLDRAEVPKIVEPSSPVTDTVVRVVPIHICTVPECGKRFKLRAIMARHFNANHEALRKDKDTWRDFTEEVLE